MNCGLRVVFACVVVALATGVGVRTAQAGLLFSHSSSATSLAQRCDTIEGTLAAVVHTQVECGGTGLSGLLSFEGTSECPQNGRHDRSLEKYCDASGGMSTVFDSLSVAGGGGGGAAVLSANELIEFDLLQVSLAAETRARMPSGPCWRWFRPPCLNG